MAKTKIDFTSQIPAAAKTPLYAGVGAGDLAVTAVLEYVADVQDKITSVQKDVTAKVADVQKTVSDFDAKDLRDAAVERAKARRSAVEARVAELQALPTKSQAAAKTYVDTVTGTVVTTYVDLAKRGEAVVNGTKLPSSASVEVKVNTTIPAARKNTRKPAVKKAAESAKKTTETAKKTTAKKASAAKAPAKKTATTAKRTAKKTATTAKSAASTTATAAKSTAASAADSATKATPSSN